MISLALKILDFLRWIMIQKKSAPTHLSSQSGEGGSAQPKTDSGLLTNSQDQLMRNQRHRLDRSKIESMCKTIATFNGVDQDLVIAIADVESAYNPQAIRYEPHYKWLFKVEEFAPKNNISKDTEEILQKCSIGVMQVMGAVARELGHTNSLVDLFQPEIGIKYGCLKLRELMLKHGSEADVISAYNQGSPRKKEGKYENQGYVDKVQRILGFRRVRVPPV